MLQIFLGHVLSVINCPNYEVLWVNSLHKINLSFIRKFGRSKVLIFFLVIIASVIALLLLYNLYYEHWLLFPHMKSFYSWNYSTPILQNFHKMNRFQIDKGITVRSIWRFHKTYQEIYLIECNAVCPHQVDLGFVCF